MNSLITLIIHKIQSKILFVNIRITPVLFQSKNIWKEQIFFMILKMPQKIKNEKLEKSLNIKKAI